MKFSTQHISLHCLQSHIFLSTWILLWNTRRKFWRFFFQLKRMPSHDIQCSLYWYKDRWYRFFNNTPQYCIFNWIELLPACLDYIMHVQYWLFRDIKLLSQQHLIEWKWRCSDEKQLVVGYVGQNRPVAVHSLLSLSLSLFCFHWDGRSITLCAYLA